MELQIEIQIAYKGDCIPSRASFIKWAKVAVHQTAGRETFARQTAAMNNAELNIRVVDNGEMRSLNKKYRGQDWATNVLAFAPEMDAELPMVVLGDIVICAPVVAAQSREQNKSPENHFAHMVVHGVLHLCGYGHKTDAEAKVMENLEIAILKEFGIANPYEN